MDAKRLFTVSLIENSELKKFELLDLSSGTKTVLPSVASFSYSPDGDWILIRPQTPGTTPAPAAEGGGRGGRGGADATPAAATGPAGDLLMRNLSTGQQRYVANVDQFAFDDGDALMAYTVRGQGRLGNGVYTMIISRTDDPDSPCGASGASADGTPPTSEISSPSHLLVLRRSLQGRR